MRAKNLLQCAWELLPPKSRKRALLVLLAFIVTSVNEATGVACVLPFTVLVSRPEALMGHPTVQWMCDILGFQQSRQFIAFLGATLMLLLAGGNLFAIATTRISLQFVATEQARLSGLLMKHYLSQPYAWFLHKNSSELHRNLLGEAPAVCSGFILPLMRLISRSLVVLLLVAGLVLVNLRVALATVFLLGGSYYLIWRYVKLRSGHLGVARMFADAAKGKIVLEALGGIKPAIVLGRESSFLLQFSRRATESARIQAEQGFLNEVPRTLLETLAFGGVIGVLTLLVLGGQDVKAMIPTLSVFTLAAYRLMPALQQSFNYAVALKFYAPTVRLIHGELSSLSSQSRLDLLEPFDRLTLRRSIKLVDLSFTYDGTDKETLLNLNLEIHRSQSVALVGSTGSGKTTLVDLILGLLNPTTGQLLIDDTPLDSESRVRSWQRTLGYVSQDIFLADASIAENIAFGLAPESIDMKAVERAASLAKIDDFVTSLPEGYGTIVGERGVRLSGGQRQRIGIARALYHDPSVLVLDEATSSLDGVTECAFMESVRELAQQKTLIIIAHRLSTIENCDRIHFLENGRLVATGTYQELLATHPGFRRMANQPETAEPAEVATQC